MSECPIGGRDWTGLDRLDCCNIKPTDDDDRYSYVVAGVVAYG